MTFKQDIEFTPVIFRAERSGASKGEVTAVFPTLPHDTAGRYFTCFAHVGQHSSASRSWYNGTRAAKPDEFAELARELESAPYGYRLKICQRMTAAHRAAFNQAMRESRS